ncbi:PAS domain S-box protein [Aquimarina agarivorans]|uniref:PAS domain S-box protein n=1 Tax=Aquimarina agarivorans TaxID=980584 RepID=UPI000248EBB3|nr:PAS domain S-box protein [Aquimarina agarivorans]
MKVFKENSNIFQLLSEAVSEGIIVVNQEQIIVACNNATNQMFGYNKEELIGKPLDVLIPQQFRHNHSSHVEGFVAHGEKRKMAGSKDLFGLRKDGTQFAVEAGLNPFNIYEKQYVMALIMDVTERKKHEKEIKELNSSLEQKIEQRTEQLNDSIKSLESEIEKRIIAEVKTRKALDKEKELNELKTKFLSLVSHEFKTPLSGILTSATLIGKYVDTEQQIKREKHLNTIKSKVKYLDSILNDFLSVERLESGKVNYNFKNILFKDLLDNVIYEAEMMLKKRAKNCLCFRY